MIQKILIDITTTFAEGASTNGAVFLGLAGREFRLDIAQYDDFQEGEDVTYCLGEGSNVRYPERNDPRADMPLTLEDAGRFPCYIRLEAHKAADDWELGNVRVRVIADEGKAEFAALQGSRQRIWLGPQSGDILYLRSE